jgi:predicted small lipoprotein YifL
MKRRITAMTAILLLFLSALSGCGQRGNSDTTGAPRARLQAVQPNEDDGAIYGATKSFIMALAENDREKILSLLTAEHRSEWSEDSYLLSADAMGQYEKIALENLQYTVVKYLNNEETNFENTGIVFAVYDVVMEKDGLEERVKIQENLAFRKENGAWLISLDERGFLVKQD